MRRLWEKGGFESVDRRGKGAEGEGSTSRNKLVLEADVEGGVGVRGECHSCLAGDVFGAPVFVSYRIFDLFPHFLISEMRRKVWEKRGKG